MKNGFAKNALYYMCLMFVCSVSGLADNHINVYGANALADLQLEVFTGPEVVSAILTIEGVGRVSLSPGVQQGRFYRNLGQVFRDLGLLQPHGNDLDVRKDLRIDVVTEAGFLGTSDIEVKMYQNFPRDPNGRMMMYGSGGSLVEIPEPARTHYEKNPDIHVKSFDTKWTCDDARIACDHSFGFVKVIYQRSPAG